MTAADKYYLKARDYYPFDLEQATEALEYGLSYDDTHAGLLLLRAEINYKYLGEHIAANEDYAYALYCHPENMQVYYAYAWYAVCVNDYKKAVSLLEKVSTFATTDKARIAYIYAMLSEKQAEYKASLEYISTAMKHCIDSDCYEYYAGHRERVEKKMKEEQVRHKQVNIIFT